MKACLRKVLFGSGKRLIHENNGSSSVLVVLILLTLVVLGLLAMMSTYSGLKLSRKNAEWTKEYYALDSKAETMLAEIDACLLEAERSANEYILSKQYEMQASKLLEEHLQTAVYLGWQKASDENAEKEYTDNLFKRLYYTFSAKRLTTIAEGRFELKSTVDFSNPAEVFSINPTEHGEPVLSIGAKLGEGGREQGRSLLIGIDVGYAANDSSGKYDRYTITSWKEIPKKFEYKDSLDFENLEVE